MSRFQFSCIDCGSHIQRQPNNLDAGMEKSCWSCNTINIIPDHREVSIQNSPVVNNENTNTELTCIDCSTIAHEGANFCHNCGNSLSGFQNQPEQKPKKKNYIKKVIGFGFILLGISLKNIAGYSSHWHLEVFIPISIGLFLFFDKNE